LSKSQALNTRWDSGIDFANEYNFENSDTYILFDKSQSVHLIDPHGYFANAEFEIIQKDAWNFVLRYDLTFAKSMPESHLVLRAWDLDKNYSKKVFENAIKVVEAPEELVQILEESPEPLTSEVLDSIPIWIKNNAYWWNQNQIDDSDFIAGIQYLVEHDIVKVPQTESSSSVAVTEIPDWVREVAGLWANNSINNAEFVQVVQWLLTNGVVKV